MKQILIFFCIVMSCFLYSCAPQIVTQPSSESDDSTVTYEGTTDIVPHTRHCEIQNDTEAMVGSGQEARMLFMVLGSRATKTYYSFAYKRGSGSPAANLNVSYYTGIQANEGTTNMIQGKLTMSNSSQPGSFSYVIIMRDKLACYESEGSEAKKCTLSMGELSGSPKSYDSEATVTIKLTKNTATQEVMVGTILPSIITAVSPALGSFSSLGSLLSGALQSSVETGKTEDTQSLKNRCIEHYVIKK